MMYMYLGYNSQEMVYPTKAQTRVEPALACRCQSCSMWHQLYNVDICLTAFNAEYPDSHSRKKACCTSFMFFCVQVRQMLHSSNSSYWMHEVVHMLVCVCSLKSGRDMDFLFIYLFFWSDTSREVKFIEHQTEIASLKNKTKKYLVVQSETFRTANESNFIQ